MIGGPKSPSRARRGRFAALLGLILLSGVGSDSAFATEASSMSAQLSQRRVIPYPMNFVWSTSIRYLRVDRGYAITDRDAESGYLIFEFERGSGSLEAFSTTDDAGRPSVDLQVSTQGGPSYLPNSIIDGILEKVREERGQPSPPPKPEPEPKPADNPDE